MRVEPYLGPPDAAHRVSAEPGEISAFGYTLGNVAPLGSARPSPRARPRRGAASPRSSRGAARAAAAQALLGARRVLITTGFTVAADAPETDGPPGAAVLGHALGQLGARVRYVTDPVNVPVLEAALAVLGAPADVFVYPEGDGVAPALLRRERPTHMIAIERPGRSREGDYLNARGASVAAWNRPIDELFVCCRDGAAAAHPWRAPGAARRGSGTKRHAAGLTNLAVGEGTGLKHPAASAGRPASGTARLAPYAARRASRVVTIGVGDGGNEIGMGNVRARLRRLGPAHGAHRRRWSAPITSWWPACRTGARTASRRRWAGSPGSPCSTPRRRSAG